MFRAVELILSAEGLSKEHRKLLKKCVLPTILVGVGDTVQKPGRTGRRRLGLPALTLHTGILATALENAIQGVYPLIHSVLTLLEHRDPLEHMLYVITKWPFNVLPQMS